MGLDSVTLITGASVPSPLVLPTLRKIAVLHGSNPALVAGLRVLCEGEAPDKSRVANWVWGNLRNIELVNADGTIYPGVKAIIRATVSVELLGDDTAMLGLRNPLPYPLEELVEWRKEDAPIEVLRLWEPDIPPGGERV